MTNRSAYVTLNTTNKDYRSEKERLLHQKEKQEMANIMICKKNEKETKRFREAWERLFIIPLSEKQILCAIRRFHMDP